MNIKGRRQFIKQIAGLTLPFPVLSSFRLNFQDLNYPKMLLRCGWNSNDNDDLANVAALYRLSQKTILNTEFYLWLHDENSDVLDMLKNNFTNLKIITGEIDDTGQPSTEELQQILSETDLFLYSSGAAIQVDWSGSGNNGIETDSLEYCFDNGIPYVILGMGDIPSENVSLQRFLKLSDGAEFIFSTSSAVEEELKMKNVKIHKLQELPNPLFAFDLRNVSLSRDILEQYDLIDKDFLCIDFRVIGLPDNKIIEYTDKISTMIRAWVKETGKYVVLLPNNEEDINTINNNIYEPLDINIKTKVVYMPEKLLPDAAASIYEKSRVVSGMSLFPACSGIQAGVPVCFLSTDNLSNRAQTIEDMGLKNSLQDLESSSGESLAEILLEINNKYVSGIIESDKAREYAMRKLIDQFENINKFINKTAGIEAGSKNKKNKNKKNKTQ